jgi:hypothetical protein
MSIRSLSQKQFEAFGHAPRTDTAIAEEVEWFADDGWAVLGIITRSRSDSDYAFAMLGRDEHGTFGPFEIRPGFKTVGEARRILFARIEKALSTDARPLPPDG